MKIFRFQNKRLNYWLDILMEAGLLAIILFFVFWPMRIDGASMENTFSTNDRVIVSRIMVMFNKLERGDIILCKIYINGKNEDIVKRLIALPGDHVVINEGNVYINDNLLNEPYIIGSTGSRSIDLTLSENEYFIMGDSRSVSYDSRQMGAISKEQIVGKITLKYLPLNGMKIY